MAAPTTGRDYAPCLDVRGSCATHGGRMLNPSECQTVAVLEDVKAERARQFAAYGTNEECENGTGPGVMWLQPFTLTDAVYIQKELRRDYEEHDKAVTGRSVTWMRLVREEIAEAFTEDNPTRLREELIQVAALCVSWIEKIDAKEANKS